MSKLVGMFICNGIREIGVSEDRPYASASSYGCLSQIEEVMPDGRVLIRKYDVTVDVSREEITAHLFQTKLGTRQAVTLPDNIDAVYPVPALTPIVGALAKKAVEVLGGRICSSLRSDVAAGLGGVVSSGETDDISYTFELTPGDIDW